MPPTEPPTPDPDPSTPPESAPAPEPPRKPGRPGVPRETVVDAIDTWLARTGRHPSIRELRTALGDTGSLAHLGRILREHKADQLLAGTAPERGSPDTAVAQALNLAMGALAAEAAEAAERVVAEGAREADARVAAAEGLRQRAEAGAAESDLARERALGRVETLEARANEVREELLDARETAATLRNRERELFDTLDELRALGREQTQAAERLTGERDAAINRTGEVQAVLEAERAERAEASTRFERERDALRVSLAERDVALARAEERASANAARADDARKRAAHHEAARDDSRARADRLDGALEGLRRQVRALEGELDAERRTGGDRLAYAGALRAELLAAGVDAVPDPPSPRSAERQDDLELESGD